eukprot:1157967-Pelagomonas_calceolata.AAC.6
MQGRRVVVICNLKPAKMRDVMSYGMVGGGRSEWPGPWTMVRFSASMGRWWRSLGVGGWYNRWYGLWYGSLQAQSPSSDRKLAAQLDCPH